MKSCIIIKDFIIIKDLSVFRILVKTQLYCSKKEALDSDTDTLSISVANFRGNFWFLGQEFDLYHFTEKL